MKPLLSMLRMVVAILDVEALEPAFVQLPPLVEDALAVVRMQMLHPELEGLEALQRLRGDAADVAKPVVDEDGAIGEVHLVEPEAGEVGRRRQAGVARAKRLLAILPLSDVDGDAHQAPRLAGGLQIGPPAGRRSTARAIAGEDDPVLHEEAFARTSGPLEGSRTRSQSSDGPMPGDAQG